MNTQPALEPNARPVPGVAFDKKLLPRNLGKAHTVANYFGCDKSSGFSCIFDALRQRRWYRQLLKWADIGAAGIALGY